MLRRTFIGTAVAAALMRNAYAATGPLPEIAVLGATARSGQEIIRQALARGHVVKGFARTPSKLGIDHSKLTLFQGDIYNRESIVAVLGGQEIVISMIGLGTPEDPMAEVGPVDIYTVMADNVISVMREKGNRRLIMASSTGVEYRVALDAPKPPPNDMSQMWRWNARTLYNDMYDMEQMIVESGLDYILLRPGFMVEEPARGDMKIDTSGTTPGARIITYPDFAAFILDNLTTDTYLNMPVGLYSDTVMNPQAEIEKYLASQKKAAEGAAK